MRGRENIWRLAVGLFLSLVFGTVVPGQPRTELDRLRQQVNSLARQGQYKQAIAAAEQLRQVSEKEFGKRSAQSAEVLEVLGALHKESGHYEDAQRFYLAALDTFETLPQHGGPRTIVVLDKVGTLYRAMERYEEAEPFAKRELELGKQLLAGDPELAFAYNSLGLVYFNLHRFTEAESLLKIALNIRETAPQKDKELIAISLDNLGQVYLMTDRFSEAEQNFLRGLQLFREALGETHPDTLMCLENLATLYDRTGRTAKAIDLLTVGMSSTVRVRGENDPSVVALLQHRSNSYLAERHFLMAEADLRRALLINQSQGGENADTAAILLALSELHIDMRDYSQADTALERVQKIKERLLGPKHRSLAPIYSRMGRVKLKLSDSTSAKSFLGKALDIDTQARGPNDISVARDLSNLAQAYISSGELAQAESYVRRAMALNEKLNSSSGDLAENYNELGSVLERLGNPEQAESAYRHSVEMFGRLLGNDHPRTINARTNLGLLLMNLGKSKEALQAARASEAAFESNLLDLLAFGTEQEGISFVHSQNPFAFLGTLGMAEPLAEAIFNYKGVVTDSVLAERSALSNSASPESRKAMDKWRETRRNLTQWTMEDSTSPQTSEKEPGGQRYAASRDPAVAQRRQKKGDLLAAELATAEANLSRQGSAGVPINSTFKLKVADIQARIPAGAALVDFIRYSYYLGKVKWEERYGAIVLGPQGPPKWVPLGNARQIEQEIAVYDSTIRGSDPVNKLGTVLRVLHDLLVAPVLAQVPANTRQLLISPDGEINFVSFAALLTPSDKFLAERYAITYLANARHLLRAGSGLAAREMLIYANPQYRIRTKAPSRAAGVGLEPGFQYPVLEPLPFTSAEANSLKEVAAQNGWHVNLRTGPQATEEDLRAAAKPAVLHLATHGFYLRAFGTELVPREESNRGVGGIRRQTPVRQDQAKQSGENRPLSVIDAYRRGLISSVEILSAQDVALDDPMLRSGVALAGAEDTLEDWRNGKVPQIDKDGILNAEEAAMLDLHGTWLVTLSSCESGRGEAEPGEGIFGLRRGFLHAGAQNIVTTLWPVNDAVTPALMAAFYRNALLTGNAPAALAEVQRDLLIRLRKERGLDAAVRLAGAFVITSQGPASH